MAAWGFDLGNSRLKFAQVQPQGIGEVQAIAHDGHAFEPGWQDALPDAMDVAGIASVAGARLRDALHHALAARALRVRTVATQARCDGVEIAYAVPAQLGVDRFLSLLAAHARGGDWLVVGVGTAMTVDLLDARGRHHGGRIAPSPTLMRAALHARANQLPVAGGRYRDFADDTADALASGCLGMALGLVEHGVRDASARLGVAPGLLLHGGGAEALRVHLPGAMHAPALVLEGLARWMRADAG